MKMQELLDDILPPDEEHLYLKRNRILLQVMFVQLGFSLLAVALAIHDIESVLGTGPMGAIIGMIVFGFAYKLAFPKGKKVGLSAPLFSSICFSLIYFLDWSQSEAYFPITTLMVFYTMGLSFVIRMEVKKYHHRKKDLWEDEILNA